MPSIALEIFQLISVEKIMSFFFLARSSALVHVRIAVAAALLLACLAHALPSIIPDVSGSAVVEACIGFFLLAGSTFDPLAVFASIFSHVFA